MNEKQPKENRTDKLYKIYSTRLAEFIGSDSWEMRRLGIVMDLSFTSMGDMFNDEKGTIGPEEMIRMIAQAESKRMSWSRIEAILQQHLSKEDWREFETIFGCIYHMRVESMKQQALNAIRGHFNKHSKGKTDGVN